jgi:hypothetical protein
MYSKEVIESSVREAVKMVTGIDNLNLDSCLVDRDMGIYPVDIIYIFEILEDQLKLPINEIFETNNAEVMIIRNLVNTLFALTLNNGV